MDIYGPVMYQKVKTYIVDNDLEEHYNMAKTPEQLLHFGYHFGVLPIVTFCYCYLRLRIAIHDFINNYYYSVSKNEANGLVAVLETSSKGSNMTFHSDDKWARERALCTRYLVDMIKFSKYKVENGKFIFRIVPKYIDQYHLLDILW